MIETSDDDTARAVFYWQQLLSMVFQVLEAAADKTEDLEALAGCALPISVEEARRLQGLLVRVFMNSLLADQDTARAFGIFAVCPRCHNALMTGGGGAGVCPRCAINIACRINVPSKKDVS